jgi:hypothetical protein
MPPDRISAELRARYGDSDIDFFDSLLRGRLDTCTRVLDAGTAAISGQRREWRARPPRRRAGRPRRTGGTHRLAPEGWLLFQRDLGTTATRRRAIVNAHDLAGGLGRVAEERRRIS